MAGRPFTGERMSIPGVKYNPDPADPTVWTRARHLRKIWDFYQKNPKGPFSYGWWDSCPGRPEARQTYYRWLKLYRAMVEPGTSAFIEVTDSDLFAGTLPLKLTASVFANRNLYLALANYSSQDATVETKDVYRSLTDEAAAPGKSWRIKARSLIVVKPRRGIGFAAAQAFAREGAKVIIAEINEELGRSAENKLPGAVFVRTDCSNSADVQALIARTEKLHGALHILYNNASVFLNKLDGPVTDLAEETWTKILAINLNSVFLCCKYAIPLLIRSGGGSIINTGSSASVMGIPGVRRLHRNKRRNGLTDALVGGGIRPKVHPRELHLSRRHRD